MSAIYIYVYCMQCFHAFTGMWTVNTKLQEYFFPRHFKSSFSKSMRDISKGFPECSHVPKHFKGFPKSFKPFQKGFKAFPKGFKAFQKGFQRVSEVFPNSFKSVSKEFQTLRNRVLKGFQSDLKPPKKCFCG